MATVTFDKASIDARAVETPAAASTAIVPVVEQSIVVDERPSNLSGANEFDSKDLNLPYLSLVQKISPLIDEIPNLRAGSYVFNKELILTPDPKTPVSVVIAKFSKVYEEDIEFGAEERPRLFKTIKEARDEGFDEEYGSEKRVIRRADFTFLIQAPAGLSDSQLDAFPFDIDGNAYALGNFTARKGAYNTTAKVVISLLQLGTFLERNGVKALHHGMFDLSSTLKTNEKNTWYQPVIKAGKKTPDSVVEFIENVLTTS